MNIQNDTNTPMWRLQGLFQVHVANFAEEVFEQLDVKLRPHFFVVGIPRDNNITAYLEPMEESGYTPESFAGVMNLAKEIETEQAAKNAWKNSSGQSKELSISNRQFGKPSRER